MPATKTIVRCPDCQVRPDGAHDAGCDVARCQATGMQRLSCHGDHDCGHDRWTGRWPGEDDAERLGWWVVWSGRDGWLPCDKDTTGATPDLNRLVQECRWNPRRQRWEAR